MREGHSARNLKDSSAFISGICLVRGCVCVCVGVGIVVFPSGGSGGVVSIVSDVADAGGCKRLCTTVCGGGPI